MAADNQTIDRPTPKLRDDAGAYLNLLNKDIERGALGRFHRATVARWQALVAHVKIDRENDRIEGDVGL